MTKRTNASTLHVANNAIRLGRVHIKLKLSFEGTGRGHHMLDLKLYRGDKERQGVCFVVWWVHLLNTALNFQYNIM